MPPREGKVTIVRFCSVRDAVMVKTYFSLLKASSGSSGRTVKYCKDPMDHPTEDLGWHKLAILQQTNELLTGRDLNPTKITEEGKIELPESKVPGAEMHVSSYRTAGTNVEESDDESEMRELSFSLAKQAFLPHIPTSPTRECFTTLCHTPALGYHTPAQSEHELQRGTKAELKDHCGNGGDSRLVAPRADESIIPVITVEESNLQSENTPYRPK